MSEKPVYSAAAAMDPAASIATANKMLSNTYWLLGLTLAFSALAAGVGAVINVPPMLGIVCWGLGFDAVRGEPSGGQRRVSRYFCIYRSDGASIGPMPSFYLSEQWPSMVLQALAGTALIFFTLSAYALNTKRLSFMGGFLITGLVVALVAMIAIYFSPFPPSHSPSLR